MPLKKILVVEDDKFLRKVYETKLPKEGFLIVSAGDGEEGLEVMKKEKPDLVLLDLIMPKKSGFQMLEEIKKDKKLSQIPVLVLSNLGQEEDVARAKSLGAKDFFIKSNMPIQEIVDKLKGYI